jgi:hypothetical protein
MSTNDPFEDRYRRATNTSLHARRWLWWLLAVFIALLAVVTLSGCAAGSGGPRIPPPVSIGQVTTLHVEVSDAQSGAPIEDAEVRLDASVTYASNLTGYVGFGAEPIGPRHVWVTHPSFEPYDTHVLLTHPEVILQVRLRQLPEPEPEPEPWWPPEFDRELPFRMDGTTGWRDVHGPRPLLGASWFPALYFAKHDRARAEQTLDMFQGWGVEVLRVFIAVGGWESFWGGREIVPVRMTQLRDDRSVARVFEPWSDWDEHFRWLLEACRQRKMGLFLTAGDLQMFENEHEVYRRAARVIREGGYQDVVTFVDVNEAWQNSRVQDDDPAYFASLVKPIADLGIPWTTSAHSGQATKSNPEGWQSEDGRAILYMSQRVGAPVATIHGTGGTTLMIRRTFNVRFEGAEHHVGLVQGEPRGPGRDVSAGRVDAQGWIAVHAAVSGMTGQIYILHASRGIRDLAPHEPNGDDPWEVFAPYFHRARAMMDRLPNASLVAWGHGGRCGTHAEALLTSTRADCMFHEDAIGVTEQFHRIDHARYADGRRAILLYGGATNAPRRAKAIRAFNGRVINTFGMDLGPVTLAPGDIWTAPGGEDGYLLVGR